ncbi:protein DDI1 homolog 2 isoform X1 [Rhineura floridana]|uniref:protein DDI1 homolog 2 isoform X1 n=1 Tax=Rhineura floridana TaxID=261503 RepID=UPI002AC888C1|nr:protein DDI1 homolog 2 isoform X1 [Rhineura floridana]
MLLTVFCLRRDRTELTFSLQVDADFELQNFRALCELESGIPAAESQIVYAERPLTDNDRSLASYGLKDGDVVILQQVENADVQPPVPFPGLPRIDFSSITVPGTSAQTPQLPPLPPPQQPAQHPRPSPPDLPSSPQGLDNPALLRDMLMANPHELSLLKERNPPLAEALLSGDLEKFTRVLVEQQQDRARREQERIRLFSADPFDLEAQAKIEEDIRQQNIEENMTIAMEEAPESFGQVVMLYINCKVNGHPVKAFVDSGAQMTIMSQACAERCNIMRLVDRRWAGIAKGVGTQKIIGRVHLAQVQIEGDFLPCSFSILEEQPMDMLLGLDMLKRHQCSIDLKKNVLVIGTTGSQTTFLPEGELPECARLAYGAGREDVRPEEIADQELAEAIQKSVDESENSDKETTSLEMSSLPTSDGMKCPVRFTEIGPEASDLTSRSLDRSVSVPSACSLEGSQAETLNRRVVKPMESLLECPKTLESKEPSPSPPNHAATANFDASPAEATRTGSCPSPVISSQNTFEEPVACSSLQKSSAKDYTLGLPPPVEVVGGSGLSCACRWTKDLDVPFPSEQLEREQMHELHLDFMACEKSGNEQVLLDEQKEPNDQEHLCTMAVSPSLADGEQSRDDFLSGGTRASEGEGRRPDCVPCKHPDMGVAEEAAIDPSNQQSLGLAAVDSDCSMMEVEWSKRIGSPSASDLTEPRSTSFESLGISAPLSGGQLTDQTEDPCVSLSSALKELHQLLAVSCKGDLNVSWQEDVNQPAAVPEEQTAHQETFQVEHECTHLDSQDVELSFPESVGMTLFEAGTTTIEVQEAHRLAATSEQGALMIQDSSTLSSCLSLSQSAAPTQLHCGERSEILPLHLSSGQVLRGEALDQGNPLVQSSPITGQDASLSSISFPEETGTADISDADAPRLPNESAELSLPLPETFPVVTAPWPPVFPAADVDQIVGAGFTPQEAGEALRHASGNADLALLILLAKNIVVPT